MPAGSVWTQEYGYDSSRRLTSVTSPAGAFDYTYDPMKLQRLKSLNLPNGAVIANGYDSVARLTATIMNNSGGTALDSYAYTYNQANERTQVTRTAGDYANYLYDNEGELTSAVGHEISGSIRAFDDFIYTYDGAGNLLTRLRPAVGSNKIRSQLNHRRIWLLLNCLLYWKISAKQQCHGLFSTNQLTNSNSFFENVEIHRNN